MLVSSHTYTLHSAALRCAALRCAVSQTSPTQRSAVQSWNRVTGSVIMAGSGWVSGRSYNEQTRCCDPVPAEQHYNGLIHCTKVSSVRPLAPSKHALTASQLVLTPHKFICQDLLHHATVFKRPPPHRRAGDNVTTGNKRAIFKASVTPASSTGVAALLDVKLESQI